jgi:hypothetical protein
MDEKSADIGMLDAVLRMEVPQKYKNSQGRKIAVCLDLLRKVRVILKGLPGKLVYVHFSHHFSQWTSCLTATGKRIRNFR